MYRNLIKSVQYNKTKFKYLTYQTLSVACYHNESSYYGYRPRVKKEWKIPQTHLAARQANANLNAWINAYRAHGHRIAAVDPIKWLDGMDMVPEIEMSRYGLEESRELAGLDGIVSFSDSQVQTVADLKKKLEETYCEHISVECMQIEDEYEREWFVENYEKLMEEKEFITVEEKRALITEMIKFQEFDRFMNVKLPAIKRYGGEGAESMVAFFQNILKNAALDDVNSIVLGMPHRGKLSALVTLFRHRPARIFRKYKGLPEFGGDTNAMMDIPSHFSVSEEYEFDGKKVHLTMLPNPSHLEAVNPVSMGKARSKQQSLRDGAFNDDTSKLFGSNVINVILHGDAALPGQGINQECLMMAYTPNFDIGGTIHMVINNQIGYTTPGDRARSSRYCTDIAKSVNAPIIHVNAEHPELVALATKLAFNYQRLFRKDVFIDFNCYRRWGHNEVDDPTMTSPCMYKLIRDKKSVPDQYAEKLIAENVITEEEIKSIMKHQFDYYASELAHPEDFVPESTCFRKQWDGFGQAPGTISIWDTGMSWELLSYIGRSSVYHPPEFNVHQHLKKTFVNSRIKKLAEGNAIDWATAEAMAFGSLMYQGHNVRLSGEDIGRGTFAQRHAMLIDQETNEVYVPLNSLKGGLGGKYEVANSILSEEAVLGFEYGMSIDNPNNLIIWESQFGDFYNGAQIVFDTFISSGETKWMHSSGLVLLLPHGMDGMASEHSSSRMERFLQMTDSKETIPDGDNVNFNVIFPTTPAQYFHAIRRQIIRNFRKPLVVIAPKTMLRMSDATSKFQDFEPGTHFLNVLPDDIANPKDVKKIILCTGKHFYALNSERKEKNIENVAIIRIESLCPFPVHDIQVELAKYKNAKICIWSQEEHRNMGAWNFIQPRFENMCGRRIKYSGREVAGTPATGIGKVHAKEAEYVVTHPFTM